MIQIEVSVQEDRTIPGELSLTAEGVVLFGPVPCLCKADNGDAALHGNPGRQPTLPFGDTPTGSYSIVELVTHTAAETNSHTYGLFPSLLLDPVSGDALTAKHNGRTGLMIHGGAPSATGGLRPTHGCIRLSESNQATLNEVIKLVDLSTISVVVIDHEET